MSEELFKKSDIPLDYLASSEGSRILKENLNRTFPHPIHFYFVFSFLKISVFKQILKLH